MKTTVVRSIRSGFTLIEVLIVITIVIVLASIVFAFAKNGIKYANSSRDMSTMRNIYQTIPLYASDNAGMLPGPLWTNVAAEYNPSSSGRLCNFIAPYLGYENPQKGDFLPAMAYTWQKTDEQKSSPCAYMRKAYPLVPGSQTTIMPFGHPDSTGADKKPKTMAAVLSQIDPSRTWVISDIDKLHPDITGNPSWKKFLPDEMSHGYYRIAIYFDGHAGKMNKDNEPL